MLETTVSVTEVLVEHVGAALREVPREVQPAIVASLVAYLLGDLLLAIPPDRRNSITAEILATASARMAARAVHLTPALSH